MTNHRRSPAKQGEGLRQGWRPLGTLLSNRFQGEERLSSIGLVKGFDEPVKKGDSANPCGGSRDEQSLEELLPGSAGQASEYPFRDDEGPERPFSRIVRGFQAFNPQEVPEFVPVFEQGLPQRSRGLVAGAAGHDEIAFEPRRAERAELGGARRGLEFARGTYATGGRSPPVRPASARLASGLRAWVIH